MTLINTGLQAGHCFGTLLVVFIDRERVALNWSIFSHCRIRHFVCQSCASSSGISKLDAHFCREHPKTPIVPIRPLSDRPIKHACEVIRIKKLLFHGYILMLHCLLGNTWIFFIIAASFRKAHKMRPHCFF